MSKKNKFTTGSLIIDGDESTCFFNILEDEGDGHFFMITENVARLADARLFKTAPKLYEMLESLRENVDMSDQEYDKVTSLLAEARGE